MHEGEALCQDRFNWENHTHRATRTLENRPAEKRDFRTRLDCKVRVCTIDLQGSSSQWRLRELAQGLRVSRPHHADSHLSVSARRQRERWWLPKGWSGRKSDEQSGPLNWTRKWSQGPRVGILLGCCGSTQILWRAWKRWSSSFMGWPSSLLEASLWGFLSLLKRARSVWWGHRECALRASSSLQDTLDESWYQRHSWWFNQRSWKNVKKVGKRSRDYRAQ